MLGGLVGWLASLPLWAMLLLFLLIVIPRKFYSVRTYPFVDCERCERGRQYSSTDHGAWRDCSACGGVGYRVRHGASEPREERPVRYAVRSSSMPVEWRASRRTDRA